MTDAEARAIRAQIIADARAQDLSVDLSPLDGLETMTDREAADAIDAVYRPIMFDLD